MFGSELILVPKLTTVHQSCSGTHYRSLPSHKKNFSSEILSVVNVRGVVTDGSDRKLADSCSKAHYRFSELQWNSLPITNVSQKNLSSEILSVVNVRGVMTDGSVR